MLFIFSTPVSIRRHQWQLKTVVCLHWCLICDVLLPNHFFKFTDFPKNDHFYQKFTDFPNTKTVKDFHNLTKFYKLSLISTFSIVNEINTLSAFSAFFKIYSFIKKT